MLTDMESLNKFDPVGIDLDQEAITNTCQFDDSGMNTDDPCIAHLDDNISPAVNNQADINHDVNSTLDESLVNIIVDNSKIVFAPSSNGSNLSHQTSVRSNSHKNTEDRSISKKLSKSKKVKQYRTSIDLTKSHAVYCKMLIVIAICCTTGFSLMPIVFYYISQIGNDAPTGPEYSHGRNTSSAEVS